MKIQTEREELLMKDNIILLNKIKELNKDNMDLYKKVQELEFQVQELLKVINIIEDGGAEKRESMGK